ncbi:DUF2116 family Zn-ribbon domain-containing protein [Butyricicoccus sp. 1XD8-22]|nr:DUF2116 family Zn-ribbon domain-containing protein [Butyricicoccus sp. 1XD8-22]
MHYQEEETQVVCVNCGEPVEGNSSFCSEFCEFDYNPNN